MIQWQKNHIINGETHQTLEQDLVFEVNDTETYHEKNYIYFKGHSGR